MSMEKDGLKIHTEAAASGAYDDDGLVRGLISDICKRSAKSRAQIAEEMELLLQRPVTLRTFNAFTADSQEKHRFPLAFARAFCQAAGDWSLLAALAERSGLRLITAEEVHLLELGRQFLIRESAEKKVAELTQKLGGSL